VKEQDARITAQDKLIKEQDDLLMLQDITIDKLRDQQDADYLKNQELVNELKAQDIEVEELQIQQLLAGDEALPVQYDPEDNSWWVDHIAGWQQTAKEARQEAKDLAAMEEDAGDKRTWSSDEIDAEGYAVGGGDSEYVSMSIREPMVIVVPPFQTETQKLIQRVRTGVHDEETMQWDRDVEAQCAVGVETWWKTWGQQNWGQEAGRVQTYTSTVEDEDTDDDMDPHAQPQISEWERRQKFSETYCGNN
jgi:hypothetical protein